MDQKLFVSIALAFSGTLGVLIEQDAIAKPYLPWVVGVTTFVSLLIKNLPAKK